MAPLSLQTWLSGTPPDGGDGGAAGKTAVVIDILRATSSIVTALGHGASRVLPRTEVEDAFALLERAQAIAESSYGVAHLETARVVEGLGYHHYGLRDYDQALRYFNRGYEIRREVFGAGHRALGWSCYDRACVLALKGERAAAIEALQEAVAVGWASDLILSDGDLDTLRGDPEFGAILDEVRTRL